jgi:hypothetical protein
MLRCASNKHEAGVRVKGNMNARQKSQRSCEYTSSINTASRQSHHTGATEICPSNLQSMFLATTIIATYIVR